MPAKTKAAASATKPTKRDAVLKEADAAAAAIRADQEAAAALLATKQAALINKPVKVKADPEGNIDERMQAVLEDHQRMGARPK